MTSAPADSREESAEFKTHAVGDGRFAESSSKLPLTKRISVSFGTWNGCEAKAGLVVEVSAVGIRVVRRWLAAVANLAKNDPAFRPDFHNGHAPCDPELLTAARQ